MHMHIVIGFTEFFATVLRSDAYHFLLNPPQCGPPVMLTLIWSDPSHLADWSIQSRIWSPLIGLGRSHKGSWFYNGIKQLNLGSAACIQSG